MDEYREKEVPVGSPRLSDTSNQVSRRRSNSGIGTNWFKKLSHKVSRSESDQSSIPSRKNSAGSMYSMTSHDEEEELDAEGMAHLSRSRSSSQSRTGIKSIIEPLARFGSPFEDLEKRSVFGSSSTTSLETRKTAKAQADSNISPKHSTIEDPAARSTAAKPTGSTDNKQVSLQDLKKRKINTRAVGFAASVFATDPPQRIPPVQPVQGCLDFLDNGELIVHRKQKHHLCDPPFLQQKHLEISRLAQLKAKENADRLHSSIAYINSGNSNGGFGSLFGYRPSIMDDEEPENTMDLKNVDGTVPEEATWLPSSPPVYSAEEESAAAQQNKTETLPPPDEIYTRCCHLREIMPIRNILRQLKGQLVPIPRVRVANTKPTLVEIQAFSDFLTVVPVASLFLDNHIMTDEMIRLILVGISRSRHVARLSLVNTELSDLGWQYLCSFLANSRKSLLALDIACTNPTAIPHRVPAFTRRSANWKLFSEALTVMGSLEDLDLGGTHIDFANMQMLLEGGFKSGKKLSLANNQLNHHDVSYIVDWANRPGSCLVGIDLSGNDLSREEDWQLVQSFLSNPRITELTLRRAKLTHIHASRLAKAITPAQASQSNLRRFDLSGNPELFPSIIDRLASVLHRFPYLSELELEDCNLNNDNIVVLCETLSHCHRLVHVSFNGNCTLNETASTALCVAVNLSHSICTVEADIPEKFSVLRNQLARYCLQNLERSAGGGTTDQPAEHDEDADISSFHDEVRSVARAINEPSKENSPTTEELVNRIDQLRSRVMLRMQCLLRKRMNGPLSVADRETTMRLFFFSNTLERLKSEVSGLEPTDQNCSEEKVNKVDIQEERPSLARQESLNSLRRLDREEAASHRMYADQFIHMGDNSLLNAVDKLKVGDLGKIIGE